jgi:hypothetical protein
MKKPQLSPFLLGVAAAGGILIVIAALLVAPKYSQKQRLTAKIRTKEKDLEAAKDGTPSRADIESWNKYRAELVRSYGDITKFYMDSDKVLERWFPNLLLGGDGDPARDTFMSRYLDEGAQLEKRLTDKPFEVRIGIDDGNGGRPKFGFNWEAIQPQMWGAIAAGGPADEKAVLHELQKRYWARQRLANIILNSGVKVSHIIDFRFFKLLHPSLNNAPWQTYPSKPDEIIHWQGIGANMQGQPINFTETELPLGLGTTLTFGFAVELPYSEVPKVIREILNPGNGAQAQDMLINLIGTTVTVKEQNVPKIDYTFIKGDAADEAAKKADALLKAGGDRPRPVLLAVTCQIIDFDSTKVRKFDAKEPSAK